MAHTTKIVDQKKITDTGIAVTVRCCGDPSTDSVLSIHNAAALTLDALNAAIDKHHNTVSSKHANMLTISNMLNTFKLEKNHP